MNQQDPTFEYFLKCSVPCFGELVMLARQYILDNVVQRRYGRASIVARKRYRNVSAEDIVGLTLMFLNSSSDQAAFTCIFGMAGTNKNKENIKETEGGKRKREEKKTSCFHSGARHPEPDIVESLQNDYQHLLNGDPLMSTRGQYIFVHKSHFANSRDHQDYEGRDPTDAEKLAMDESPAFSVAKITRIYREGPTVKAILHWEDAPNLTDPVDMQEWLKRIERISPHRQIRSATRLQGICECPPDVEFVYAEHLFGFSEFAVYRMFACQYHFCQEWILFIRGIPNC